MNLGWHSNTGRIQCDTNAAINYSAFGKYSDPLNFPTVSYITDLFKKLLKLFCNLHTIPHNENRFLESFANV
jgi:hypothetical protein